MNTKQKRVVVTLFLALAAMATTGFAATNGGNQTAAITPDHLTCELVAEPYSALELLNHLDDPCFPDAVYRIETEIDQGSAGSASTVALLDSILERSRAAGSGSVSLLEQRETEVDAGYTRPSVNRSLVSSIRSTGSEPIDVLNRPQDEPRASLVSPSASVGWSIDYHNPSSLWADNEQFAIAPAASERSGARLEWFVNYLELTEPGLDPEVFSGEVRYEGFIDYHNPSSPWADTQ